MSESKIENLLSILSISKEEQYKFLYDYFVKMHFKTDEWPEWYGICDILIHGDSSEQEGILTTLAFKLRNKCQDPFGWCAWDRACWEVWKHFHEQLNNNITKRKYLSQKTKENYCLSWMVFWAEPIHWIIAALLTKEIVANPEEKFDAHLVEEEEMRIRLDIPENQILGPQEVELSEVHVLQYGIAQDDGEGCFGFWDGPNPSLEAMLEVDGRDENSVIWRFNEDGTDDLIYRWGGDGWVEVGEDNG